MQENSVTMPSMTEDIEAWRRVGTAVAARRIALRLTQADAAERAGMSTNPWQVLENARQTRYRSSTLIGVCEALGWTPGSIEQILAGDEPELVSTASREPAAREFFDLDGRLSSADAATIEAAKAAVRAILDLVEERAK